MYQCSKKERQTYPIRPHHGMCLAFFIGNGYSNEFTAHMQEMLDLFTKGADVTPPHLHRFNGHLYGDTNSKPSECGCYQCK